METFKFVVDLASLIANIFTSIASAIAIALFVVKRREISSAFKMLLNWTFQSTLSDLKGKLERLNEYNAAELSELAEIKNILHEIAGQVRGNTRLQRAAPELARRIETLAGGKRLTEPAKRSIVAEVREVLRTIQVNSMNDFTGDPNE